MPRNRALPNLKSPNADATPEDAFLNRREWIKWAGAAGLGVSGLLSGCQESVDAKPAEQTRPKTVDAAVAESLKDLYPARRNESFTLDRELTDAATAATHNNFYEFSLDKSAVSRLVSKFVIRPWEIEITGLVRKPLKIDVDDLSRKMTLEERLYRFRCVERWAMTVPWVGFPMSKLIKHVEPLGSAKYLRFVSFMRPDQAPNQTNKSYPWPFYEALRIDEAMNDLAMFVTGVYGKPLPKQHGAPLRAIVPWKYGYKSPKSIVKIEFTEKRPPAFWNDLQPKEYSWLSNVDPTVPHPRWSQARETMIGTGREYDTMPYNGYAEQVAGLYKG